MPQTSAWNRFAGRVCTYIPPTQFSRYLLVGLWNTIFGYGAYAALTAMLTPHVPYAYMVASAVGGLFSITGGFLAYKWFVFKTRGNYLREWSRCILVYSGSVLIGTVLLPVFVYALRHLASLDAAAPYIAGAIVMGLNVIAGFLGHRNFSFANTDSRIS